MDFPRIEGEEEVGWVAVACGQVLDGRKRFWETTVDVWLES